MWAASAGGKSEAVLRGPVHAGRLHRTLQCHDPLAHQGVLTQVDMRDLRSPEPDLHRLRGVFRLRLPAHHGAAEPRAGALAHHLRLHAHHHLRPDCVTHCCVQGGDAQISAADQAGIKVHRILIGDIQARICKDCPQLKEGGPGAQQGGQPVGQRVQQRARLLQDGLGIGPRQADQGHICHPPGRAAAVCRHQLRCLLRGGHRSQNSPQHRQGNPSHP